MSTIHVVLSEDSQISINGSLSISELEGPVDGLRGSSVDSITGRDSRSWLRGLKDSSNIGTETSQRGCNHWPKAL